MGGCAVREAWTCDREKVFFEIIGAMEKAWSRRWLEGGVFVWWRIHIP